MRIVGGNLKGRKIFQPRDVKTRPLKDLVKESIFNLLNHSSKFNLDLNKSSILDCFSGTGSFGLECLSRGANDVTFVENYKPSYDILKKNIHNLNLKENSRLYQKDFFKFLDENLNSDYYFDLIFLDPPYRMQKVSFIIQKIKKIKILKKKGLLILHRHKKENLEISKDLEILDCRIYGISKIIIGYLGS